MNRRYFLKAAAGLVTGHALAATKKPNIVLIVADDLGYADLSIQGSRDIQSPNIDSIGKNGVRFTNGYVSCPVCSPTRAGLLTGRYQQRFGHELNPGSAEAAVSHFGLPLTETTLADKLRKLGYRTGMFGKWHLGYKPEMHPQKRGFDEFFGFLGGAHSYVDANADRTNPILRGTAPVDEKEYTTVAFAREAAAFIDRNHNAPFFVYLPFNAVHAPMQALAIYKDKVKHIADPDRQTFAAMHMAMDEAVGRVLKAIKDTGKQDDTLIFFISDNGGPTPVTTSSNQPLRGHKAQVLEGGIRIPFMVQWKGHIPAGRVYDSPVISLDIHPTAIAAADGTILPLDGVNLLPFLDGKQKGIPHDRLFWRFGAQWAVRLGDWKLLSMQGALPELYNLKQDVAETKNLAATSPEKVKELRAAYDAWNSQMVPPLWQTQTAGNNKQKKKTRKQ